MYKTAIQKITSTQKIPSKKITCILLRKVGHWKYFTKSQILLNALFFFLLFKMAGKGKVLVSILESGRFEGQLYMWVHFLVMLYIPT